MRGGKGAKLQPKVPDHHGLDIRLCLSTSPTSNNPFHLSFPDDITQIEETPGSDLRIQPYNTWNNTCICVAKY
ncbi:predicted protein [Lichtheimia corymbifera JMRC:FSU:9682]|uniref:Uncharacterized protein n=1 Tax=Lichtheimia corymbifera JMRC:FSU:9682 TaxID=1263082 RepID=A0A068RL97_9FUNG|nr:predicted protein [Lichtheimia corymbifera JMRC:FSU:9682]